MRHKVSAGKTASTNSCHVFSRVIGKRVSNLNCCIQLHCYVVICDTTDFQFNLPYFQVDGDDRTVFHYIDTAGFLAEIEVPLSIAKFSFTNPGELPTIKESTG